MGTQDSSKGYDSHDEGPSGKSKSKSSGGKSGSGGYGNSGTGSGGFSGGKGGSVSGEGKGNRSGSSGKSSGGGAPGGGGGNQSGAGAGRGSSPGGPSLGGSERAGSSGTSQQGARSQAAESMRSAGIGSVGGRSLGADRGSGVRGGMVSDENANRSTNRSASYDRSKSLAETGATARDMQMSSMARAAENQSMDVYSEARRQREENSLRAGMAQTSRAAENKSMADLEGFKSTVRDSLLDAIAGPESANQYDVMYGGTRFASFEDHPRTGHAITSGPNKGKVSTAAGRHQMLEGTWDRQAAKLGLTDFSPKNQDIAAFDLAKTDYSRKTGRNLETDLASAVATGDMAKVGKISRELSGTWTSLPGGIEQQINEGQFARSFESAYGRRSSPDTQIAGGLPDSAPTPTSRPDQSRFASNYLGKTGRMSDEYSAPVGATSVASAEEAYFGQQPIGQTADERAVAAREQEARLAAAQPSTTRTPTDIGTIAQPASLINEDNPLAGMNPVPPNAGPFPERPRTTGQTVAAAGIDLGMGMLPGPLGMGISLVNGGLALTGNRTLGERIVDDFATGKGGKMTPNDREGGAEYDVADNRGSTVQKPTESFEDRYMAFVDPTKRPTPAERWGTDAPYSA